MIEFCNHQIKAMSLIYNSEVARPESTSVVRLKSTVPFSITHPATLSEVNFLLLCKGEVITLCTSQRFHKLLLHE